MHSRPPDQECMPGMLTVQDLLKGPKALNPCLPCAELPGFLLPVADHCI